MMLPRILRTVMSSGTVNMCQSSGTTGVKAVPLGEVSSICWPQAQKPVTAM